MVIQALCDYYRELKSREAAAGDGTELIPGDNYSYINVRFLVSLTEDGKLDSIQSYMKSEMVPDKKGKLKEKLVPRVVKLPRRIQPTNNFTVNYIEHRSAYLFGLEYDSKADVMTTDGKTGKQEKAHAKFVEETVKFMDGLQDPLCKAFSKFAQNWDPKTESKNPMLLAIGKDFNNANFVFCLAGRPDKLLHNCPEVISRWEEMCAQTTSDNPVRQCSIYGTRLPIARTHDKIKGVPGGQSSGTTLVSFNSPAESSYGLDQSYNSAISESAMHDYTRALNFLIASAEHRIMVDDLLIVHWASNADENVDRCFNALILGDTYDAETTEAEIEAFTKGAKDGVVKIDPDELITKIDSNVTFYMLGLKANGGRLSVEFFYRQSFGDLIKNLRQHQDDMRLFSDQAPIPLWRIKKQLLSGKSSSETVNPNLMSKMLESAMFGYRYPAQLFSTVLTRVKTDLDDPSTEDGNGGKSYRNDAVRMGIIKACVNRNYRFRNQKEEIQMALDKTNTNPAYLCGRLFAVLENLQRKAAAPAKLNRTIKDSYFKVASTRPASTFPVLMNLAQHHMAKLDNPTYIDEDICEITSNLGATFPTTLSQQDQGVFILGYYHQKSYINDRIKEYTKKNQED